MLSCDLVMMVMVSDTDCKTSHNMGNAWQRVIQCNSHSIVKSAACFYVLFVPMKYSAEANAAAVYMHDALQHQQQQTAPGKSSGPESRQIAKTNDLDIIVGRAVRS